MTRAIHIAGLLVVSCILAALVSACGPVRHDVAGNDSVRNLPDGDNLLRLEKSLAAIEADLELVAVQRAVLDNELAYTRGLDRHDEVLIDGAFWPDAQASYGKLVEIDRLAEWANESHAAYAVHQHHVTGVSIDARGDFAHEEGYVIFSSDMARDSSFDTAGVATPGRVPPGTYATLGSGRYVNQYVRRNGEWKLLVHEYVHEVSMRLEAVDLCAVGCLGRRDTSDISYMRPLQPLSADERRSRALRGKSPHAAVE